MVQTVSFWVCPVASAKEGKHHPTSSILTMSSQRKRVDGSVGTTIGTFRGEFCHRLEDDIDNPENGFSVASNRFGRLGIQQAAFRNDKTDRFQHSGICRDFLKQVLEGDITGGNGSGARNVDRPGTGFGGSGKIQRHFIS